MNRGRRLSEMDHPGSHIHVSPDCLWQPRAAEQSLIDYLVEHSVAAGPWRVEEARGPREYHGRALTCAVRHSVSANN